MLSGPLSPMSDRRGWVTPGLSQWLLKGGDGVRFCTAALRGVWHTAAEVGMAKKDASARPCDKSKPVEIWRATRTYATDWNSGRRLPMPLAAWPSQHESCSSR